MTSRFESGSESHHTAAADVDNPFRVELMATRPKTEPKTDAPPVVNNIENNHFNNPSNSKADAAAAAAAKASADATARANATGGNASARSGDATATAGSSSAKTGDVTVNNNGSDESRRVPDVTVVPASVPKTEGGSGFSITKQRGSNIDQITGYDFAVGRSNSAGASLGLPGLGIGFTAADGGPTAESEARMQATHDAGKYLVGGTAASMIFDNDPEIKKVSRDGYLETLKKKPESK